MEAESGCRIFVRGRGAGGKDGNAADETEDMHVLIEGESDEAIANAERLVKEILFNHDHAMALKRDQLRALAAGKEGGQDGGMGGSAAGSFSAGPSGYPGMPGRGANAIPVGGGGGGGAGSGAGYPSMAGGPGGMPGSGGASETFGIPTNLAGYVIGRGGENIHSIQTRTGCRLQIQRESEMMPGAQERSVTITGTPEGVAAAKQEVLGLIAAKRNEMAQRDSHAHGGMTSGSAGAAYQPMVNLQIPVPNDKVGIIIGKQGATIRGIEQRTAARVQVRYRTLYCRNAGTSLLSVGQPREVNILDRGDGNNAASLFMFCRFRRSLTQTIRAPGRSQFRRRLTRRQMQRKLRCTRCWPPTKQESAEVAPAHLAPAARCPAWPTQLLCTYPTIKRVW